MISIEKLTPSDIEFIMGLWQSHMGGDNLTERRQGYSEYWLARLKANNFDLKLLNTRWHRQCDMCLAINPDGHVYALSAEVALMIPGRDDAMAAAADHFVVAVSKLGG